MTTLSEDPSYNELIMSSDHQQEEHHQQNRNQIVKEESDYDRELFQSSINDPIIIQNKLNNEQQLKNRTEIKDQNLNEQKSSPHSKLNGQQNATPPVEEQPLIQRFSDAVFEDITNKPYENSQEYSQNIEVTKEINQSHSHQNETTTNHKTDEVKEVETVEVKEEVEPTEVNEKEAQLLKEQPKEEQYEEKDNGEQIEEKVNEIKKESEVKVEQKESDLARYLQILAEANVIKDQGKVCVQKKQYREAIKYYEECLQVVHISNFKFGEDKKKYINIIKDQVELTIMLLCNLSLCYFNEGVYEISLQYGEKVSVIDPNHLKAAYRRALALKKLERYDKAFEEIKNARLIAIGKQQIDESINKEYKIIKQLYTEQKGVITKNNSINLENSGAKNNISQASSSQRSKRGFSHLTSSSMSNVADFLDNNFPGSIKTTPFYAVCSTATSYVVLKRFMGIDLITKPAYIGGPLLSLSIFGFLQGKSIYIKLLCGGLIGIISSVLYKFADFSGPKAITL